MGLLVARMTTGKQLGLHLSMYVGGRCCKRPNYREISQLLQQLGIRYRVDSKTPELK